MFKNIIKSEFLKLYSYNWCFFSLIGTVLIAPLLLFFSEDEQLLITNEVLSTILRNLFLSQAGLVILTASFFGQEYSHSYLRTTLLTIPSRMKFIITKMTLLIFIVCIIGLLSSLMCLIIGVIRFNSILTIPIILNFLGKISVSMLSWMLISWITASLTIITQSQIVPSAIMFSFILGLSQMLLAVTEFAKYLPDLASMSLFFISTSNNLLNSHQGILVQFIWALSLGIIALYLFQHRDVR